MPDASPSQDLNREPQQQSSLQTQSQPLGQGQSPSNSTNNDPIQNQTSTDELKKIRHAEWWLIMVGVAGVVVNVILGCVYYGQLQQMRIATEASRQAVDLARDTLEYNSSQFDRSQKQTISQTVAAIKSSQIAAKSSRDAELFFASDERAWLELGPLEPTGVTLSGPISTLHPEVKGVGGTTTIKNYGKTLARDISVRETFQSGDVSFGKKGSERLRYIEKTLALGKNTSPKQSDWIYILNAPVPAALAPGSAMASSIPVAGLFSPGESTYVVGRISYKDSFGFQHWTTFCYRITEQSTREYCEMSNDEDSNQERPLAQ